MGERVGFIGLGIMGRPMARHLLQAGFPLIVHSRSPGPVQELAAAGAEAASSSADVAAASTVVITMLPDTPDVEEVVLGPNGVAAKANPGALVIDMSTIDPSAARRIERELRGRGLAMLDAPVSGGEKGAVEATLSIMVGGNHTHVVRAMPLFECMGRTTVHVGSAGAGQVCKACNQLIVAATIEAVAEAIALAERSGVDSGKVREALLGGFAASKVLEVHGQRMLERSFDPGFRVRLHAKDARIILQAAADVGLEVPGFAPVAQRLDELVLAGDGELDHSGLFTLLVG